MNTTHRYYMLDLPREYCDDDQSSIQIYKKSSCGLDYLMDYNELKQICQTRNWPVPVNQKWCDFPEPLELLAAVEKENTTAF